ncbi:MAG TPA: heme o synthase [Limnochordia bacterium]|nr:heme o synthase [Limnochordia bacterium]
MATATPRSQTAPAGRAGLWRQSLADYVSLTKPRIILLVLITTFGAMWMAAAGPPPLGLTAATLIAVALAVGGSHTFNMVYDRDIDAVMSRTRSRPLPGGRITPAAGLWFSLVQCVLGVLIMWAFAGATAALLNAAGIFAYTIFYTVWLKRNTPHNTVLGGVAGAIPPVIGWAAVTHQIAAPALLLFGILFFWQPAHFWALVLFQSDDYKAAKLPMVPITNGTAATRRQMLIYTGLLYVTSLLLQPLGYAGWLYEAVACVLGAWFLLSIVKDMRARTDAAYRHLFRVSILYLGLLFLAIAVDFALFGAR